ncbi:hypothetical protein PR048_031521 [Dryococelus australis]|uniref:DUF5641 domain-containing protein n=1 Tax=Dryococelus australis TaxID=614101 RepID=A0ABQ9G8H2_9NEOP|nr:hypothetical protein PR048_031521 [Dryococelus australis]
MIGYTKRCLRKVLRRSQADHGGLNTILISTEDTLNSRRLAQNAECLTPAHFLNGEKMTTIPNGPEPSTERDLTRELRHKQRGLLTTLEKRVPFVIEEVSRNDARPRHTWKRARIEEVRRGRDTKIRGINLRQPDGTMFNQPIQLVILLEVDQDGEDVADL